VVFASEVRAAGFHPIGQNGFRVLSTTKLDLFLNSRGEAGAPAGACADAAAACPGAGAGGRTAKTEVAARKVRKIKGEVFISFG
jgi:hypothetical protein